ncbi:PqqD family protein [Smaragdicoccus niigatensis]|uniref:PqqD family protein n=1 Tax=Smaragdicoccus niigatensis TaxID=359359 RepID=UPI00038130C5|nr:PqqD family protein [Smaragdicoccus niigatensis]
MSIRLRPTDVALTELDGEVVLLDLQSSRYLSASGTGVVLVRLLQEGSSEEQLVSALTARFDVDVPTATTDVRAFLNDLRSRGLLEES